MAGNDLLYGVIGFLAGVVVADKVRGFVSQTTGFDIPSLYAHSSYPAYDETTRTSFVGATTERDYDSELETHINHIPVSE